MFVVMAGLCAGAFTLGGAVGAQGEAQGQAMGIPPEHPVALAMRFRQELGLTPDQTAQLEKLRGEMAKEFAPIRERAESIQQRMQELQRSGKQDQAAASALQREAEALGGTVKPMFERYAQSVFQLLGPEQREKLMRLSDAHAHEGDPRAFVMMFMMQAREQLGINPQQFTKLQYLQADFIRAFAPLREQMEMLQLEAQEKFGKVGKAPPAEFMQHMEAVQKKVKELQGQFSERAVKEVLQPDQRVKLEELLRGEHRSGKSGG